MRSSGLHGKDGLTLRMAKTGSRFGSKRHKEMRNAEMNELDWKHPM